MENNIERFVLKPGERFRLHELNGGAKTICARDGRLYTAEHRSRHPGRHVARTETLEAVEPVAYSGRRRNGREFAARFVTGPDRGKRVTVNTNHAWPFAAYVAADRETAESEARRQRADVEAANGAAAADEDSAGQIEERMERRAVLPVYDANAPKRATNVSVNSDLLDQARRIGINVSQELESRLVELVTARRREEFLEANREAFEAYNRRIERSGVFGDGRRLF